MIVNMIFSLLDTIDNYMYYPVLIIVMTFSGLLFTALTKGAQIRLFPEALRLLMEKPEDRKHISSLQAMLVSTASRVGTGNIVGVSTAICLGGPGACFWMWLLCIIGASSAFVESTLAQIYKRKDYYGGSFGGPAYYIEKAMHAPVLASLFSIFLVATYAFGFNLLCSYNLQSTFAAYSFYNDMLTPMITGFILALCTAYCLTGGGARIIRSISLIVPFMGVSYVLVSIIVILFNITSLPFVITSIFRDAFDFRAIFGGISGSCMIYGIKRGLYSNEAGVGSAPNASAVAKVSHPVKQGLVQTLSVYIDTLILCTATAIMCLSTGVERSESVSGALYVQNAISTVFGKAGPVFITIAMVLFAFTTIIGNLFYVKNALIYLNNKRELSRSFMRRFYFACVLVVFIGAMTPMSAAWALADITMGCMTLINLPACMILSKVAIKTLKDYEKQKAMGKDPVFYAKNVGVPEDEVDFWK